MGLSAKEAVRKERILAALPKVKAKADAGNEGAAQRLREYEAELVLFETVEKGEG